MKTNFKVGSWGYNPSTKEYRRFNTDFELASWNMDRYEPANLKKLHSYYCEDDEELPYVFDLLWDIKTLGELWFKIHNEHLYHPSNDIQEIMNRCNIDFRKIELKFTKEFKKIY